MIRCPLSAIGYRLPAAGVPSAIPPSPLRGPLPPDKQWGAREYIGARHLPLDRGGQGRSADFRLPAAGYRLLACLRQSPLATAWPSPPLTSSGAQGRSADFRLSASGFRLTDLRRRGDRAPPPSQKTCPPPQSGVGDHGVVEGGGRYKLQD